jgi:hypothetical protein
MIALGAKIIDTSGLTPEQSSALIIDDFRRRSAGVVV